MKNIAVFPGSFDPFTLGHKNIVDRSLSLFDEIIIAIGSNSNKKNLFPIDKRIEWIRQLFKDESKIKVDTYHGLTTAYCQRQNARFILRGLRNPADFEFEKSIASMNAAMSPEIESVFLIAKPEHSAISSTIIREIIQNGGDVSKFIPYDLQ